MPKIKDLITAIEIGTESIKVFCGAPSDDDTIDILGFCEVPTLNRVRKGEVTNVTAAVFPGVLVAIEHFVNGILEFQACLRKSPQVKHRGVTDVRDKLGFVVSSEHWVPLNMFVTPTIRP